MTALEIVQKFHPKVNRVVDAIDSLMVEVSKRDANSKAVKDHTACAFAEACKRSQKVDGAVIARRIAYLVTGDVATRYTIPPALFRKIMVFDRNGEFAPGVYKINKPEHKLGDRGGRTGRKGNSVAPKFRHVTSGLRSLNA